MKSYTDHMPKAGVIVVTVSRMIPEKYIQREYVTNAMRDEAEALGRETFALGYQRALDDADRERQANSGGSD